MILAEMALGVCAVDVSRFQGPAWRPAALGRGAAFADFDNDGYIDILVGNGGDAPSLLHNLGGSGNHFINLKLTGTKSNRDAMGARIRVQAGSISQIREVQGGGSYLSQSDLRAHFGLGGAQLISSIEIAWPSGAHQVFHDLPADRFYLIVENQSDIGQQHFIRSKPIHNPVSSSNFHRRAGGFDNAPHE